MSNHMCIGQNCPNEKEGKYKIEEDKRKYQNLYKLSSNKILFDQLRNSNHYYLYYLFLLLQNTINVLQYL